MSIGIPRARRRDRCGCGGGAVPAHQALGGVPCGGDEAKSPPESDRHRLLFSRFGGHWIKATWRSACSGVIYRGRNGAADDCSILRCRVRHRGLDSKSGARVQCSEAEAAFHRCIVPSISLSAHGLDHPGCAEKRKSSIPSSPQVRWNAVARRMIPSRGAWKSLRMEQPRAATRSSLVIFSLESGSRARRFSGSMAGTSELLRQALKNTLRRA
jgi:hypothetical protein